MNYINLRLLMLFAVAFIVNLNASNKQDKASCTVPADLLSSTINEKYS